MPPVTNPPGLPTKKMTIRIQVRVYQSVSPSVVRQVLSGPNNENLTYVMRKLENRDSVEVDLVKGFFGRLEFVVKSWSSTTLSEAEDMINDILDTAHDDLTDLIPDSCLRARARFRQLPCHRAKRQRLE